MSKIFTIQVIVILLAQPVVLFAEGTFGGLEEKTYSDPNWVLVISDVILRENLCSNYWYEKVLNPCALYQGVPTKNKYWGLESCAQSGQAFPLAEISKPSWSLDSLYVREGVGFQLYGPDEQPYGFGMVGPKYVSIEHWRDIDPPPDGFEPGTFFVNGGPGGLKDYSIIVYPNSLELAVNVFGEPNCVSEFDYMTYTIFYTPGKCEYGPVQVTDYLPAEVDFDEAIPDTGIYDPNNHAYTWNTGTLEPGETGYVTLSVVV